MLITPIHRHQNLCVALFMVALTCTPRAFAGFDEGLEAAKNGDFAAALREWQPLAIQGNTAAQFNLGLMYNNGNGVPRNYKEAGKWFRKAAEQGNARAQLHLGLMYNNGNGVPQDHKEAVKWYRKAAELGDADAQHALGLMYGKGEGVPQNHKEAVEWFRKAAEQGNASVQYLLGLMHFHGEEGVPQDYKEAVKWFRKAAEQGDASAQFSLGVMYGKGYGVPHSRVAAYALFNLSATSDLSDVNKKATENRADLAERMGTREIEAAQLLTKALMQPGGFGQVLDWFHSEFLR